MEGILYIFCAIFLLIFVSRISLSFVIIFHFFFIIFRFCCSLCRSLSLYIRGFNYKSFLYLIFFDLFCSLSFFLLWSSKTMYDKDKKKMVSDKNGIFFISLPWNEMMMDTMINWMLNENWQFFSFHLIILRNIN